MVAAVGLVFGANAVGCDNGGGKSSGASEARQKRIAKKACTQFLTCYAEEYAYEEDAPTQAECEEEYLSYFDELEADAGKECLGLALDGVDCYASASCEELEASGEEESRLCQAQINKFEQEGCDAFFEDEYSAVSAPAPASLGRFRLRLR